MLTSRIEPQEHLLRFGAFTLDIPARTLMHRGNLVVLTPKEFDVLAVLTLSRGSVVSKDDLIAHAWTREEITDAALFQTVYRLRRGLAQYDALTEYIITVPGRGYQFVAPVVPAQPSGQRFDVEGHAFTYYSRAMFQFHQRTERSLSQAIALFRRALQINSQLAPAYVGIAHAHLCAGVSLFSDHRYAYHQARRACRKALAIDPQCGDAYAILSEVEVFFENDFQAAEQMLRRALVLAPYSTRVRTAAFWVYLQGGDVAQALFYVREALAADPSSNHFTTLLGVGLYYAGRYAEAHEHLIDAHLFRPADSMALFYDAGVLYFLGEYDGALARLQTIEGNDREPRVAALRVCIAAAQGRSYLARALAERLQADGPVDDVALALAYTGLGEFDRAARHARKASQAKQTSCYLFNTDPLFRPLRDYMSC
jgi:DNA-binding winged helix-turn-helix (wHTH) protein/Tfp pilus assembly protein PilF